MPHRARELALALAAAAAVAACSPSTPQATPTPTPAPVASSSAPSSPTPTPTRTDKPVVLGVIGDYGVDERPVRAVVAAMAKFAPRLDAVVTTGDNAYCCGDAQQAAFARSMLAPLHAPVYAALGNHDVKTRGGQPVMTAFGLAAHWYTAVVGPIELVVLDANRTGDRAQLAFLRQVLAASRPAAFRVVVFHQPGWSCSLHGPDPGVVQRWIPLFQGNVDLVLAGHNHTYERFTGADGTPYVTTGGGGAHLYPSIPGTCKGAGHMAFVRTVFHALRLTATSERLTVEAIGTNGKAFDRFEVAGAS